MKTLSTACPGVRKDEFLRQTTGMTPGQPGEGSQPDPPPVFQEATKPLLGVPLSTATSQASQCSPGWVGRPWVSVLGLATPTTLSAPSSLSPVYHPLSFTAPAPRPRESRSDLPKLNNTIFLLSCEAD
jgi:hypothetical protein